MSAYMVVAFFGSGTVLLSEEMKSDFLKSHDPRKAIGQLGWISSCSTGRTSSAGNDLPWSHKNVSHSLDMNCGFRNADAEPSIALNALYEDAQALLSRTECEITSQRRSAGGGFTITYRTGRSVGEIHAEQSVPHDPAHLFGIKLLWDEEWLVDFDPS